MKKILTVLVLVLTALSLNAQTVKEKKVFNGLNSNSYTLYDFSYDNKSGTYIYAPFDTIKQKTKIVSNKGNSGDYDYFQLYDAVYDNSGNYYVTAVKNIDAMNGISENFLIRNGKEIFKSSYINFPISKKEDGLYFISKENGYDVRVKYNFSTNQLEYGNKYDTIFLAAVNDIAGHGEPSYQIGFTKTGKEYYAASKGGKHYFIIGETESKPYSEILYYNTYEDKAGNICFVAKEFVNGKNQYFLVQGDKEYKKFAYINFNVVFDNSNVPYYCASENYDEEYTQDGYLIKGDEKISRNYLRGIYDLTFTPSGKIVYTGSDTLPDGTYKTTLFIDGNEYLTAGSIWGITFYNDDTPYYYTSDESGNATLYKGKTKISETYSYINEFSVNKSGMISFVGTKYGDYDKNIPNKSYYVIGDKKFGPFEEYMMGEYEPNFLEVSDNGNYAYTSVEAKKGKEGEIINKYSVVGKDWKSPKFEYINDLTTYKNDFYYTGVNYNANGRSESVFFKNGKEIVEDYEAMYNVKFDKEKGLITFIGQKDREVYFVEIKL